MHELIKSDRTGAADKLQVVIITGVGIKLLHTQGRYFMVDPKIKTDFRPLLRWVLLLSL